MPVSSTQSVSAASKTATGPQPKNSAEQVVFDAYRENLGRAPDAGGLKHFGQMAALHLLSGKPAAQVKGLVAEQLRNSDEWRGRMVDLSYQTVLGRKADKAGREHHLREARGVMAQGKSAAAAHQHVIDQLKNSDEWRGRLVVSLFQTHLGRKPDAGGLAHWKKTAGELAAKGKTPDQVGAELVNGLQNSDEWRGRMIANVYQQQLGRAPDAGGKKHYADLARRYASVGLPPSAVQQNVIASLQNSAEWQKKNPGKKPMAAPPSPEQVAAFFKALSQQNQQASERRTVTAYYNGRPASVQLARIPGGDWMRVDAADAMRRMHSAAARDGIHLSVTSGFRSMAEQQHLYNLYRAGRGNLAARPGYSNHQGGIAVDIAVQRSTSTPEYRWLAANARSYGFVRTVPSEPWHWEFRP